MDSPAATPRTFAAPHGSSSPTQPRRPFRRLIVVFGASCLLMCLLVGTLALAQTPETATAQALTVTDIGRTSHTLNLLSDGRVLVAGGWDGASAVGAADVYDPATQTWQPTGAMSQTRAFHAAAPLPGGAVLVSGGWNNLGWPLATVEVYQTATETWTAAAALQTPRAGHGAVSLLDGRVLVVGGCQSATTVVASAELYDGTTNAWQSAGALTEGRCWHTATRLSDGRVLVVGGRNQDGAALANAELYDPASNQWRAAAALASARMNHTATLLADGRVLVAGGYDGNYLASAELYDPVTNQWTATASLGNPRALHAAVRPATGPVLVVGGFDGAHAGLNLESYDPVSSAWSALSPLPAAYAEPVAVPLRDGMVLITGHPLVEDPTGNAGYPTPTPRTRTPYPTSTPLGGAGNAAGAADGTPEPASIDRTGSAAAGRAEAITADGEESSTPTPKGFSVGTEDAALFGVHEVSFYLPVAATPVNPYGRSVPVVFTATDGLAGAAPITVTAFYSGSNSNAAHTKWEIWAARVYVNRLGVWTWQAPPGAESSPGTPMPPSQVLTFTAREDPSGQRHGMLRVTHALTDTAVITGTGKRWYTDDGHTFLPIADTAYRLFFNTPATGTLGLNCPPVRSTAEALAFVDRYATEVRSQGVNVLRVESLGTWAYPTSAPLTPTPVVLKECNADLSLFWSATQDGSTTDLFNAAPSIQTLATPTNIFYPNLKSLQNTDAKLRLLLEKHPSLYVQLLLVPEPESIHSDHAWVAVTPTTDKPGIDAEKRRQMWQSMVAHWAAFPNVFWSVSNDLADTMPNNKLLGREVGCYWIGAGAQSTECNNLPFASGNDPWRKQRPMSMGHLRDTADSSTSLPWHSYVTVYTGADISAQQMDGSQVMPSTPQPGKTTAPLQPLLVADTPQPSFNVEDQYENANGEEPLLADADYFYRRLFWSHLLSGSGATYGSDLMWNGQRTYSAASYTMRNSSGTPIAIATVSGLKSIESISRTLGSAHVDLALFKPNDSIAAKPQGSADRSELERAQVAAREPQELMVYLPNAVLPSPTTYWDVDARRKVVANANSRASVTIMMTRFPDSQYQVTWYDPKSGLAVAPPVAIPGRTASHVLTAPASLMGDALVHISSRCAGANKCLLMDSQPISSSGPFSSNAFFIAPTKLSLDPAFSMIGNSWRFDGRWWIDYQFPAPAAAEVSTDFYFRRNTANSSLEVTFFGSLKFKDPNCTDLLCPDYSDLKFHAGVRQDGTVYANSCMLYLDIGPDKPIPGPWICSDNLLDGSLEAAALNRWYRFDSAIVRLSSSEYRWRVSLDGMGVEPFGWTNSDPKDPKGDIVFFAGSLEAASQSPTDSIWLDELATDPVLVSETTGLFRRFLQQGSNAYTGTHATYFDYSGGYNNAALLRVGANNGVKTLLRFDTQAIPVTAVVDEALLKLYNTGRSNANSLVLGAHEVLAEWAPEEASRQQRRIDSPWNGVGMAAGADYASGPTATALISSAGASWTNLDVTTLVQQWISNPDGNRGLVLTQEAASGFVVYDFCSELGWTPCTADQAPRLEIRYHLTPPAPAKVVLRQGANNYTGTRAIYFDGAAGYNNSPYLLAGADNAIKALLRYDLSSIPSGAIIDEATLRLYQFGRNNGNTLTLGAHQVQVDWSDAQANKTQRQSGVAWSVVGMGSGTDFESEPTGIAELASAAGAWVDLDVKAMAQDWVARPADNFGLVLTQEAASGSVYYTFCSELGWSPCNSSQAPQLTIWYH